MMPVFLQFFESEKLILWSGYYRDNNYQICSRSSPKPGCLPDPISTFILPMMDEQRERHRETVECAKENVEFKEEEEDEENETREGSQKEQESLYDKLQQFVKNFIFL